MVSCFKNNSARKKRLLSLNSLYDLINAIYRRYSLLGLISLICLGTPSISWASSFSEPQPSLISQSQKQSVPAQIVAAVRQDLSRRTEIPPTQLRLKQASQRTWPDGCLGLASPGEICTQVLVQGWQIVLVSGDRTWTYRTDATGRNLRLVPLRGSQKSKVELARVLAKLSVSQL